MLNIKFILSHCAGLAKCKNFSYSHKQQKTAEVRKVKQV